MSLQVEKIRRKIWRKLTIEVSAEELEKALQAAYKSRKAKSAFRDSVKEKLQRSDDREDVRTSKEIFYEDAANALIPEAYAKHMMSANLRSFPADRSMLHRLRMENHSSSQQKLLLNRK